jgi:hypothetical protein
MESSTYIPAVGSRKSEGGVLNVAHFAQKANNVTETRFRGCDAKYWRNCEHFVHCDKY